MTSNHPLALQSQLAGLAALESDVRLALHALHATYPSASRPQRHDELFEVTTARMLAEISEDLLVALDDHRSHVAYRLQKLQQPDQTTWPF